MQLQAAIVTGWHRGLRLCLQLAGAVFMPYLDFPRNLGRIHNQPSAMYIGLNVHVRNENAGVKSRIVYRCFFNGRDSIGNADSIGAGCEHAPPAARHGPAAPL